MPMSRLRLAMPLAALCAAFVPPSAAAQAPSSSGQPAARFELPPVVVTAEKRPEPAEDVNASLTAVTRDTIERIDARFVKDAARFAPNVYMHEFSARKLSNPRFRGIGSSPNNPAITTYIDGVPQLNANSSSVELIDVEQIEFIRGPQSALFGRNTVGGVISVASRTPSLTEWTGSLDAPFGNYGSREARLSASGPLVADRVAIGLAAGYAGRDGFSVNDATGRSIDDRAASYGKVQMLWTPNTSWHARLLVSGERARDGDYPLKDLRTLRQDPYSAPRNFDGSTERDVVAPTFLLSYTSPGLTVSSTTGVVRWTTHDTTDLDYGVLPLIVRTNEERSLQVTQEVRLASPQASPLRLSDTVTMAWQAGMSLFTQRYDQDAVNAFAPFVLSPFLPLPANQHSPVASLDDSGVGAYGQGTWTVNERVDLSVGARVDRENKDADIRTFFDPPIAPPTRVEADASFTHVSPRVSAGFRVGPTARVYATVAQGYKAGGFNATSPLGREAYDEETSWNYEGGVKTTWLDRRLSLTAAVFRIDWRDLQVNLPSPQRPAQFFIDNAGGATSSGLEVEAAARPAPGLDLFGSLGYTRATFNDGTTSSGVPVGGNVLPYTPDFTANVGAQYTRQAGGVEVFVRGDVTATGEFAYDDFNAASQEAYTLAELRGGIQGGNLLAEIWVKNAFDARYVPLAFAYPGLAPSGFIGEPGAPRTYGVRLGVRF
ncbi:MAG: TonB-dependent receptor [Acidimicrobiia bacterium]|nr:TonB-dependent receptor [Acidimicrobiia bacterium]